MLNIIAENVAANGHEVVGTADWSDEAVRSNAIKRTMKRTIHAESLPMYRIIVILFSYEMLCVCVCVVRASNVRCGMGLQSSVLKTALIKTLLSSKIMYV